MTPEKRVENHIRKTFLSSGGWITKIFASPNTNKGIPDLLGVLNGRFVALEIKRQHGGKPTPVQLKQLQRIANAGGIALVTNDTNIIKVISDTHTQKLSSKQVKIDYAALQIQPNVKAATALWRQTKGIHSLQLLPQNML